MKFSAKFPEILAGTPSETEAQGGRVPSDAKPAPWSPTSAAFISRSSLRFELSLAAQQQAKQKEKEEMSKADSNKHDPNIDPNIDPSRCPDSLQRKCQEDVRLAAEWKRLALGELRRKQVFKLDQQAPGMCHIRYIRVKL